MNLWISGGLAVWAAAVAWKDWQSHRVPNVALILVLVPASLALIVNGKGVLGVAAMPSLIGFLVGGGIMLPGYALGKMGAGDVKLAACMGLLLGSVAILRVLLVFAILLGALSAVAWLYYRQVPDKGQQRIAAAPALAVAFIVQLLLGGVPSWSVF